MTRHPLPSVFQHCRLALAAISLLLAWPLSAAEPLRVFIRAGEKTHGPADNGLHDHPRFLADWTKLLSERRCRVNGGMEFPTAAQLEKTDVLILFAANGGTIPPAQREYLNAFLRRGGGMVVLHDAVVGDDADWFKTIIGGAWQNGKAKWLEGPLNFYVVDRTHPIMHDASNFDIDDEIYYDLNMMPEARILGAAFTPNSPDTARGQASSSGGKRASIYDIQPQMWTYEKQHDNGRTHRAFVCLLGHKYSSFTQPHVRAMLLRGIAWAGGRANADSLCKPDELAALPYPEGGPTAPEKSAAKIEMHPDFKLSLVAAEPLINKPIAIDWDPAGSLWVAETPEYPNGRKDTSASVGGAVWKDSGSLEPGKYDRPARDRISILESPDAQGRFRKKRIFFEGLELVTGFVFHRDGVIVSQAPDILWLRDTNGDGRADKVEKLYTGLGTQDTHAVINNLRWGYDGWIYATHGYSNGDVKSPDGTRNLGRISSGVVRFKPDGSAFEMYSSKGGNTWGLDITWDGEVFYTQPTSGDLLMHVVLSEAALVRGKVGSTTSFKPLIQRMRVFPLLTHEQQAYVQIDQVGMFTAAAGAAMYGGGAWPAEWNYGYFTTEPTVNLVHHSMVSPAGPSYSARKAPGREETEFMRGTDPWFRPIETRIGADGALYVLDFYNQAVIHNDTRGPTHNPANAAIRPDRDHYFGRIWRVDHQQAKPARVPNLARASTRDLINALEHANTHVRNNAFRLLVERNDTRSVVPLKALAVSTKASQPARVLAVWALARLGALDEPTFARAANDEHVALRKNAFRAVALQPLPGASQTAAERVNDADARVRIEALQALADASLNDADVRKLVSAYPSLQDRWLESAFLGVAARAPEKFLAAALDLPANDSLAAFAREMAALVAANPDSAARAVVSLASQSSVTDVTKARVLQSIASNLRPGAPTMTPELQRAMRSLLSSQHAPLAAAALPLVANWDRQNAFGNEVKGASQQLLALVRDSGEPEAMRTALVSGLLGVRALNAEIEPALANLLVGDAPSSFQQRIIEELGRGTEAATGSLLVNTYPKLTSDLQTAAFDQLLKRADWTETLLTALKNGSVPIALLDAAKLHRLRTHANVQVAQRAVTVLTELRGPETQEKDMLIAKLLPEVEKPGDAARGRELFTQNCATCHVFGEMGREVGPHLTGMGAHGAAGLLVSTLDPNRVVDPAFLAWTVETDDDEVHDGILVRENPAAVVLRNAAGEIEIPRPKITVQRQTQRSLMPEGFEALGADGLRDLFAFMMEGDNRFRFVDLSSAFTADARRGMFHAQDRLDETLSFKKHGVIQVDGVPFNVIDSAASPNGRNVVLLKGGTGHAGTMPERVEVALGFAASRLHFLGGVGGWAWGYSRRERPVMRVTVHYADGQREEIVMRDGREFADYVRVINVPGSQLAGGVVDEPRQIRWFTKPLQRRALIDKLVLESFDNAVAPLTVAITAELSDGPAERAAQPAPARPPGDDPDPGRTRVLIAGGGSAHDFDRWFNQANVTMLNAAGFAANYTDKPDEIAPALANADVLYLATNQKLPEAARKGIFDFANAGKGLMVVHAGGWYNWPDWPEFNRQLVAGGTRSHEKFGEFEVTVDNPDHPVMAGVPARFKITDELYRYARDTNGPPIQVLATGTSLTSGESYPVVWIVKHPNARIVVNTLGHDGKAHEHPAFQTLLRNGANWAAGNKVEASKR